MDNGISEKQVALLLTRYPCFAALCRTVSPMAELLVSFLISRNKAKDLSKMEARQFTGLKTRLTIILGNYE